jgi:hypothetical protein
MILDPIVYLPLDSDLKDYSGGGFDATSYEFSEIKYSNISFRNSSVVLDRDYLYNPSALPIVNDFTIVLAINPNKDLVGLIPLVFLGSNLTGIGLSLVCGRPYGEYPYGKDPYGGFYSLSLLIGTGLSLEQIFIGYDIKFSRWTPIFLRRKSNVLTLHIGMYKVYTDNNFLYSLNLDSGYNIGTIPPDRSYYYTGGLDEFYIYNKALTDEQYKLFFPIVYRKYNQKITISQDRFIKYKIGSDPIDTTEKTYENSICHCSLATNSYDFISTLKHVATNSEIKILGNINHSTPIDFSYSASTSVDKATLCFNTTNFKSWVYHKDINTIVPSYVSSILDRAINTIIPLYLMNIPHAYLASLSKIFSISSLMEYSILTCLPGALSNEFKYSLTLSSLDTETKNLSKYIFFNLGLDTTGTIAISKEATFSSVKVHPKELSKIRTFIERIVSNNLINTESLCIDLPMYNVHELYSNPSYINFSIRNGKSFSVNHVSFVYNNRKNVSPLYINIVYLNYKKQKETKWFTPVQKHRKVIGSEKTIAVDISYDNIKPTNDLKFINIVKDNYSSISKEFERYRKLVKIKLDSTYDRKAPSKGKTCNLYAVKKMKQSSISSEKQVAKRATTKASISSKVDLDFIKRISVNASVKSSFSKYLLDNKKSSMIFGKTRRILITCRPYQEQEN